MPTRLGSAPRECPIGGPGLNGCGRTVRSGHLMCGHHWSKVPRDLQSDVWRTWRAWCRTHDDDAWEAYSAARLAAIAAVEKA